MFFQALGLIVEYCIVEWLFDVLWLRLRPRSDFRCFFWIILIDSFMIWDTFQLFLLAVGLMLSNVFVNDCLMSELRFLFEFLSSVIPEFLYSYTPGLWISGFLKIRIPAVLTFRILSNLNSLFLKFWLQEFLRSWICDSWIFDVL